MKKILIAAALLAATAVPASSFAAGAPAAATPKPAAACFLLPLLPDCLAAWKADTEAFTHKVTPAPKTAAVTVKSVTPTLPKMPVCTRAAAGAGHLYDCK